MKKNLLVLSSLLFTVLLIHSCKEVGPSISLHINQNALSDTAYIESPVAAAEIKLVMIEDFTGVKCTNCPQGHQVIEALKAANPNRIVSVSMHPKNSLGLPYTLPSSYPVNPDLRNNKVQDLMANYFSFPGFEPCGAIDRQSFSGETNVLLAKEKWTGYVNQETALTTPVNLLLSKTYDSTTRELKIITELHYTQNVAEKNKMTVLLTEGNIVASQLDGTVVDTFYTHKDVLRDFISDTRGDTIIQPHNAGRVAIKTYKTTLSPEWKPANMKVIAYVHEYENSKVVYQAKEVSVQ